MKFGNNRYVSVNDKQEQSFAKTTDIIAYVYMYSIISMLKLLP